MIETNFLIIRLIIEHSGSKIMKIICDDEYDVRIDFYFDCLLCFRDLSGLSSEISWRVDDKTILFTVYKISEYKTCRLPLDLFHDFNEELFILTYGRELMDSYILSLFEDAIQKKILRRLYNDIKS